MRIYNDKKNNVTKRRFGKVSILFIKTTRIFCDLIRKCDNSIERGEGMKIEIEVKAFGEVDGNGDVYKGTELIRLHNLPKDTTLGEIEALLSKQFQEVEEGYKNPEHFVGKVTIRLKKEDGKIVYLG